MAGENGSLTRSETSFREAYKTYLLWRFKVHADHVAKPRSTRSVPYVGPENWTTEEKLKLRDERLILDEMARQLNLTSERRKEIESGVARELESA